MTLKLRALALLSPLLLALPLNAQEQDQDQPAVAFGSGSRMVRGTVTAVSPDHLTLKTESGELYQVAVTPNTQVRKGRDPVKFAEDPPRRRSRRYGRSRQAPPRPSTPSCSWSSPPSSSKKPAKTWAKPTSPARSPPSTPTPSRLTILRSDGVSQTITVDEGTSFKRGGRGFRMAMTGQADFGGPGGPGASGAPPSRTPAPDRGASLPTEARNAGEPITLADIKVGDLVGGPGGLKNGTFIPTELDVADPAARRHRPTPGDPNATPKP